MIAGEIGKSTASLWEWTLVYRGATMTDPAKQSWDLQGWSDVGAMTGDAKLEVEQG